MCSQPSVQMELATLDLGPFDADDDANISEYFVRFGDFDALLNKSRLIMVGVKGAGKSAVKKYLYTFRERGEQLVIEVNDTYSLPVSQLDTSSPAEIKNKMKGYLMGIIIQYLLEAPGISGDRKNELKQLQNRIPFVEKILKSLTIKPIYFELAVSELFQEDKRSGLFKVIAPSVGQTIRNVLDDGDLWVLIDDVHRVFTSDDRNLSLQFVEGLIYAVSDLTIQMFNKTVCLVLFLRAEIYDELILRAEELDKELQYIWRVVWDSEELSRFLAERIRWALDVESELETWECWQLLFDTKTRRETCELQQYVIERVINGPRDLLLLIDGARKIAVTDEASKIDLSHIEESEFSYGEEKLNQINRNFRHVYSDIKLLLDYLFRRGKQVYTRGALEDHISERLLTNPEARKNFEYARWVRTCTPFAFLEILYRIGFIGYWDPAYEKYVYALEKAKPDKTLVHSERLRIHSAFTKYLELES